MRLFILTVETFLYVNIKVIQFDRQNIRMYASGLNLNLFLVYATDITLGYFNVTFFYDYMNFPNSVAIVAQLHQWIIRKKMPLPLEHIALQGQLA